MNFVVSASDAGDFVGQRLAWDVLNSAAVRGTHVTSIDLEQVKHLKPYSIACIAAIGQVFARQLQIRFPADQACAEHLARLGLHRFFASASGVPQVELRPTNVPIEHIYGGMPNAFANRVVGMWATEVGQLPAGLQRSLENHLDEMLLNSLGHSRSEIGCIVVGQAFPTNGKIEATILDFGQTIFGHLSQNQRYRGIITSDEAAIKLAMQPGVTGTPDGMVNLIGQPNSGAGLTELMEFCGAGCGVASVLSGASCVTVSAAGTTVFPLRNRFLGTLVNICFHTDIELHVEDPEDILL
jgi:hypothetical protein